MRRRRRVTRSPGRCRSEVGRWEGENAWKLRSLNVQQLGLGEPGPVSGEASEAAVCGEDAVTRDDDGNGISGQGLADGASLGGAAHGSGQFAVGAGLAGRDPQRGFVDLTGKRCHLAEVQRNIPEVLKFAAQMPTDFPYRLGDCRRGRGGSVPSGLSRDARFGGFRSCFGKLEAGDGECAAGGPWLAPGDAAGAEWGVKEAVGGLLHGNRLTAKALLGDLEVHFAGFSDAAGGVKD